MLRYIRSFDFIYDVSCVPVKRRPRFKHIALIRFFDAISELYCVFLRRRRFEIIALYPNFDVISEVNCVLLGRRRRIF